MPFTTPQGRSDPAPNDLAGRRIGAIVRMLVASVMAAAMSIGVLTVPVHLAWVAGGAWLPAAAILWFAVESRDARFVAWAGAGLDLGMLLLSMAALPGQADTVLWCGVVAVACLTYYETFTAGLVGTALLLGARVALAPIAPLDVGVVVMVALVAAGVSLLLERAKLVQRDEARRVARFRNRSETILQHVAEAVVVTDEAGMVSQHNVASLATFGAGELEGRHCNEVFGLRNRSGALLDCSVGCALLSACAGGQTVEVLRDEEDDRSQVLLASAVPIDNEVVHTFSDISALREADQAKAMFLATTSHELKTPIATIRGFARIAMEEGSQDLPMLLQVILDRSEELQEKIDALLLSSRMEAGRMLLKGEEVRLGEFARVHVGRLAEASARRVELVVHGDPVVHATRSSLGTILDHLVDNAMKYSPGGEVIEVTVAPSARGGRISVTDHGIGMSDSQMARCFERFWRADNTNGARFSGTGLGLFIVKGMVDRLGGHIHVESERGRGTTFHVELVAGSPADPGPRPAEPAATTAGGRGEVREFVRQLGLPGGRPLSSEGVST